MMISIDPNYELFMAIILVLYAISGVVDILVGVAKSEIVTRKCYGSREVIAGCLAMCVVVLVVF